MTNFRLRFKPAQIRLWAQAEGPNEEEERIRKIIVPKVKSLGYVDRPSFLAVCKWKTPRSQKQCMSNPQAFIEEVTGLALRDAGERLRIESLTLLNGVSWPTASVFLHFFHDERYPILDFRALWSLSAEVPKAYNFEFWYEYTKFCRALARKEQVNMRTLDRALWHYSRRHQSRD